MEYSTRSQFQKAFYAKFKPFAQNLGFTMMDKKEPCARKMYDWGWVDLEVSFTGNYLSTYVGYTTRINKIEEIVEKFIEETGFTGREIGNYSTYTVPYDIAWPEVVYNQLYKYSSFQLSYTEQSLLEFFDLFTFMVNEKIIPLWQKWQDIKEMEKVINESDRHTALRIFGGTMDFFLRKIIITNLAGNPNYESIFSSTYQLIVEVSKSEATFVKYPQVLEKLYEYLKTVEPLY